MDNLKWVYQAERPHIINIKIHVSVQNQRWNCSFWILHHEREYMKDNKAKPQHCAIYFQFLEKFNSTHSLVWHVRFFPSPWEKKQLSNMIKYFTDNG